MKKFISSSVYKNDLSKVVELAKELDCGIEISRFKFFLTEKEKQEAIFEAKKALQNFEGQLSLHGYFFDLNVASRDSEIERISNLRFNQTLEVALSLGIKRILFHTGYNAFKHKDYQKQFAGYCIDFWKKFVPKLEETGVVAVLENVLEENPQKNINIVETINSPNLKLALDVGHANVYSDVNVLEWIKTCKKHLIHLHLHNNFGDDDSHYSILNGSLKFEDIFQTLKEENIDAKIVFEIFTEKELRESVQFFNSFFSVEKV